MFDTMIESTRHGRDNTRTGLFLFGTGLLYSLILLIAGVATIIMMNPGLGDALDVKTMLTPPPPPPAPPPPAPAVVIKNIPAPTTFTAPIKPPEKIPDPTTIQAKPVVSAVSTGVPGGVPGGQPGGVPGGVASRGDDPPPPPPPPPPKPEPTPPPKQIKVSGGVLQGSALKRVQPQYPPIAKAARASGAVQVQVTISEDGRVIDAQVVNGHPLLRDAALQAARQWVFKPTELSGVPVKVQGVLTFNFTLQ